MAWIKKNLVFVICCGVAVALLGVAIFFWLSNSGREAQVQEELNQAVNDWNSLNTGGSFPSDENIEAAKREQEKFRQFRKDVLAVIPQVAPAPKMNDQAFASFLGNTIAELRAGAAQSGVALPQQYDFTFAAQRKSLNFPAGSIDHWSPQLSDIKAICGVLYQARVIALDGLQRVPVSTQDTGLGDFLTGATIVSNQFGVFAPYQVSFRSFSPEIASVLDGFERAKDFIVVKSLTVVPAAAALNADGSTPAFTARAQQAIETYRSANKGTAPATQPRPRTPSAAAGGVVETVLAEQPLQVTLLVDVIKLSRAP